MPSEVRRTTRRHARAEPRIGEGRLRENQPVSFSITTRGAIRGPGASYTVRSLRKRLREKYLQRVWRVSASRGSRDRLLAAYAACTGNTQTNPKRQRGIRLRRGAVRAGRGRCRAFAAPLAAVAWITGPPAVVVVGQVHGRSRRQVLRLLAEAVGQPVESLPKQPGCPPMIGGHVGKKCDSSTFRPCTNALRFTRRFPVPAQIHLAATNSTRQKLPPTD